MPRGGSMEGYGSRRKWSGSNIIKARRVGMRAEMEMDIDMDMGMGSLQ